MSEARQEAEMCVAFLYAHVSVSLVKILGVVNNGLLNRLRLNFFS